MATTVAVQDCSQLKKDCGAEQAEVITGLARASTTAIFSYRILLREQLDLLAAQLRQSQDRSEAQVAANKTILKLSATGQTLSL